MDLSNCCPWPSDMAKMWCWNKQHLEKKKSSQCTAFRYTYSKLKPEVFLMFCLSNRLYIWRVWNENPLKHTHDTTSWSFTQVVYCNSIVFKRNGRQIKYLPWLQSPPLASQALDRGAFYHNPMVLLPIKELRRSAANKRPCSFHRHSNLVACELCIDGRWETIWGYHRTRTPEIVVQIWTNMAFLDGKRKRNHTQPFGELSGVLICPS